MADRCEEHLGIINNIIGDLRELTNSLAHYIEDIDEDVCQRKNNKEQYASKVFS